MDARSIASLTISFGLVAIPVKLYSATLSTGRISFNMLHAKDGSRLKQQYVCAKEGTVVERNEDAPPSDFDSPMFAAIAASVRELNPAMAVVPYLSSGATDSARLRQMGMQAFGVLPFPMNQDDEDRMHGNDERVPLASLEFGTRLVYGAMLRVAC